MALRVGGRYAEPSWWRPPSAAKPRSA